MKWIITINGEVAGMADLRLVPSLQHLEDAHADTNHEFKFAGMEVRVQNYERLEREERAAAWRHWMGEDNAPEKGG